MSSATSTRSAPRRALARRECSLYYDQDRRDDPVGVGDVIETEAGTRYLVISAREVVRRDPDAPRRTQMRVIRNPEEEELDPDGRRFSLRWYKR